MNSNFPLATVAIDETSNSVLFFLRTFLTFISLLVQLKSTNQALGGTHHTVGCPTQCLCVQVENRPNVDCSMAINMTTVPQVPMGTMMLKMDNANLSEIRDRQYFLRRDLSDVYTLSLRNCKLREVRARIFWGLYNLKELNLAYNEIRQIAIVRRGNVEVGPFVDMKNLQTLHLSYNNISIFYTTCLDGAINLIELDLSFNKITFISGVFDEFVNMKRLHLQNNKLKYLDSRTFEKLPKLNTLNLLQNPYHCDCKLRTFVVWQREKYLSSPPECGTPQKLRGKIWDQINDKEFACPPEMEPKDAAPISRSKGQSVSLVCTVRGDPRPVVSWNFRNSFGVSKELSMENSEIYNFKIYDTKFTPTQPNVTVYNLTIKNLDQSSVGVYHCIGDNPADKDYVLFQVDLKQPVQIISQLPENGKNVNNGVTNGERTITSTALNKSGANNEDATGANIVLIGIVLGAAVSVLTAMLIVILCYRHMSALTREQRNASPVRQIQNGYGYHVIDNDISKSSTTMTEKSPEKFTIAQYSSSSKCSSSGIGNSLRSTSAALATETPSTSIVIETDPIVVSPNFPPLMESEISKVNSPKAKKDSKRVLRFAVDENPDRVPRQKPIYQKRNEYEYYEDDYYGMDVRETAI